MATNSIRLYPEPNPNGQFSITSPDVPGLVTEGDSPATIQKNVHEALDALQEPWTALSMPILPALRPVIADRPLR